MRMHVKQTAMTRPSIPITIEITPSGLDAWKLTLTPGGGETGVRVDLRKSDRASVNNSVVVVAAAGADDIATVVDDAIVMRLGMR